MLITWHGHSEFLLESASGFRVLTDPFDGTVGYPMKEVRADVVTVSHGHGDHSFVDKVTGWATVLRDEGTADFPENGVQIRSMPADHDDQGGAKRGKTLLTVIRMDGLKIAHLGDLGCPLSPQQASFLANTDILLLPVGGYFTIDGRQAAELVRSVRPRVAVSMHYKTRYNASWPISGPEVFLEALGIPAPQPMPLMRVTQEDLRCLPSCCMFCDPQEEEKA